MQCDSAQQIQTNVIYKLDAVNWQMEQKMADTAANFSRRPLARFYSMVANDIIFGVVAQRDT